MMQTRNRHVILAAALAAAAMFAAPAFGQVRANQDGHANDASNQVGSGGYNLSSGRGGGITPNQIIYGNVTGGLAFQGPHERDPRAFTGPSSSIASNFIRGTTGVPQSYAPSSVVSAPQPFYGENRAVAPPIGTERLGISTGNNYIGTSFLSQNPYTLRSDINSALAVQTQRLGESTVLGSQNGLAVTDAAQLNLNGPLEAQNQAQIYTGSPLYGVRGLGGAPGADDSMPLYGPPSLAPGGTDRFRVGNSDIQRMRSELNNSPAQQLPNGFNSQNPDNNPNAQQGSSLDSQQNLSQPPEGPSNNGTQTPANNSSLNNSNLNGGVNTQQGLQTRLTVIPARQQSATYRVLSDRLKRYESPQLQQIQASAQVRNQIAARQAKAAAGGGGPTSRPSSGLRQGMMFQPGSDLQPGTSLGNPPAVATPPNLAPVRVSSLADGVSAKGLHDLLASAEDLMRQDKFQSAIDKYNTAEEVAPNNGLIALGRANAELGAGYYNQASTELHQLFASDPALLMGQYELKNWMSSDRVEFINKELTGLAASDTKQETPVFLLAYLAYNTGQEAKAAEYLKEARQRSDGKDPVLDQLEARWRLPQPADPSLDKTPAAPDLNK